MRKEEIDETLVGDIITAESGAIYNFKVKAISPSRDTFIVAMTHWRDDSLETDTLAELTVEQLQESKWRNSSYWKRIVNKYQEELKDKINKWST